jgi:hypothetical protein
MEKPKFTTYIATAQALFEENPKFYKRSERNAILSFAKYLDSGREMNGDIQILAYMKAQQIDREVILALADALGRDKAAEITKAIHARHKH